MKLTKEEYKELAEALLSAFPTKEALTRMLRFGLDENLEGLVGGGSLKDSIFQLIQQFEAKSTVLELVKGARKVNPTNVDLIAIEKKLKERENDDEVLGNQDHSNVGDENNEETPHNSQSNSGQSHEGPGNNIRLKLLFLILMVAPILIVALSWFVVEWFNKQCEPSEGKIDKCSANKNSDWVPFPQDFNGTTMMLVPAGSFTMGRGNGNCEERPAQDQRIDNSFWIDTTEVTREAYGKCVSAGICADLPSNEYSSSLMQPINQVFWSQAEVYCTWRKARLPTESEWEYAARGPDNLIYPWDRNKVESDINKAHYNNNKTEMVGSYPEGISWVGALDMSGNVWEWTKSFYTDYPYFENVREGSHECNGFPDGARTLRGGSFQQSFSKVSAVVLHKGNPEKADPATKSGVGFRCARSQ